MTKMSRSKPKNWYDQCAQIVMVSKPKTMNDAYEVVNKVCEVLEKHCFIDSDWWAENERMGNNT